MMFGAAVVDHREHVKQFKGCSHLHLVLSGARRIKINEWQLLLLSRQLAFCCRSCFFSPLPFPVRDYIKIAERNPLLWNCQVAQSEDEAFLTLCSPSDTFWSHSFAVKSCQLTPKLRHDSTITERQGVTGEDPVGATKMMKGLLL